MLCKIDNTGWHFFDGITDVRWRKSVLQTYTFSQNAD